MKGKVKILIDILMTFSLMFLMGYQFWGEAAHEWVGTAMFLLFIAHHVLNWNWHKTLFRGKYTPTRIFLTVIDVLTLLSMLVQMYSGIVMSRYVFEFLPIESGLSLARKLHILGAYWGFLLMSLHIGLHWNMVVGAVRKKFPKLFKTLRYVCLGVGIAVALYGAWVFIKRDFPTYMFLKSQFVFLDYEEPIILFYLDYLALTATGIVISHYLGKLLRRLGKKEKKK